MRTRRLYDAVQRRWSRLGNEAIGLAIAERLGEEPALFRRLMEKKIRQRVRLSWLLLRLRTVYRLPMTGLRSKWREDPELLRTAYRKHADDLLASLWAMNVTDYLVRRFQESTDGGAR